MIDSMATAVIPTSPPTDTEHLERITKLAGYVARNGPEFEQKVREKEVNNPHFEFLRDATSEEFLYYKWHLFCLKHQYSADQIKCMEDSHNHKLEWNAAGSVNLLPEDAQNLAQLLRSNNGSKDSIKAIRKWVLDRAHSIQRIGIVVQNHAIKLYEELGNEAFSQILHTAYVLNDLFYNSKGARSLGPYTRLVKSDSSIDLASALRPNLAVILKAGLLTATEDAQREKVTRLVQLWTSKEFISAADSIQLLETLSSPEPLTPPPAPVLTSPYLENPLPSNAPPEPKPLQLNQFNGGVLSGSTNLTETQLSHLQAIQLRIQEQMAHQQGLQQHAAQVQQLAASMPPSSSTYPPHPPHFLPEGGTMHGGFNNHNASGFPLPYPSHGHHGPGAYPLFPVPGNVHPHAPAPYLDLAKIPVGNMANIVKAAKKAGHPPHTTIDVIMYAANAAPHVEPGRLEIRVAEFYRQAEALLNPEAAQAAAAEALAIRAEATRERERERDGDRHHHHVSGSERGGKRSHGHGQGHGHSSNESTEEGWERYVPGYDEEKQRAGQEQDWDRPRPRKQPRFAHSAPTEPTPVSEISEDNMGHKLLRGLGWQQGSGLGADSSGIVEPISAKPITDRSGVGLNTEEEVVTLKDGSVDFSAYRKQLSSHYHSRITERG